MNLIFYTGLSFILLHELDAVRCKEWNIFPGLSLLNEKTGKIIFVVLHLPLIYWVSIQIKSGNELFKIGFDYFLILHLVLHLFFILHEKNEFRDWKSWTLISGAGFFGLFDLLIK